MSEPTNLDNLENATSQRLARLGTMPVDTGALDRAIATQIPRPSSQLGSRLRLRVMRIAAAAIVLVGVGIAALVFTSGHEAFASPAQMAQVHQDLIAGRVAAQKVSSIEEANRYLAGANSQLPSVPNVPAEHVMKCCLAHLSDRKVAFVLMEVDGKPVTLAVAKDSDLRAPSSATHLGGCNVERYDTLNMVMCEKGGRFVCMMGELPHERLKALIDQVSP